MKAFAAKRPREMELRLRRLKVLLLSGAAVMGGLFVVSILAGRRIERLAPPQGDLLVAAGRRLHYLDRGAGPPVVLIHGLGGQLGNFAYALVERLSQRFRVVAFDRPGSGYSPRRAGEAAGVRAQADAIAGAIRELKLERPVVVGHSLGGAVALALALDHPDCVGALALVSPLTRPEHKPPLAFKALGIRSPLLRRLVYWTIATPASLMMRNWTFNRVFAPETPPPDFGRNAGGLLAIRPNNIHASSEDMNAVNDDLVALASRYPSVRMPVGVLFGRDDAILDPREHGERMRKEIPSLDLEFIPGGHMLPVTRPDATAAFIARMAEKAAAQAEGAASAS